MTKPEKINILQKAITDFLGVDKRRNLEGLALVLAVTTNNTNQLEEDKKRAITMINALLSTMEDQTNG